MHELDDPGELIEAPTGREMVEMEGALPVEMEAPLRHELSSSFLFKK
jgi:hypothetical protein